MFRILLLSFLMFSLGTVASAQEKKRYVLYAALTDAIPVELADGAKWKMDKGDTFPVVMFKERHTKVILQLAGTSFMVSTDKIQVIEEKDVTEAHLATYRTNVSNYLESQSEKWKERAR